METIIIGTGSSRFGMFVDTPARTLAAEAVAEALKDAGLEGKDVGLVLVGNAVGGVVTGQEMIRSQTILSQSLLVGRPMAAVENACASSSSAFYLAHLAIQSGMHDVVVVVGAEKMTSTDRTLATKALAAATDVSLRQEAAGDGGKPRPVFMEIYAANARNYMARSGATAEDFADVVAKNTRNGSLNPIAQVKVPLSREDVLNAREIVAPLTRPMCAGIGDGAAAIVLCSSGFARAKGKTGPKVRTSLLASAEIEDNHEIVSRTAAKAFEAAGISPEDVSLVELHDAAAPAEIMVPEELLLVAQGDGPSLIRSGASRIDGRLPINPSGGLTARGHPVGATGAAQIVELANQLRGRCGPRQVANPRIGLAENAGGSIFNGAAACMITLLEA